MGEELQLPAQVIQTGEGALQSISTAICQFFFHNVAEHQVSLTTMDGTIISWVIGRKRYKTLGGPNIYQTIVVMDSFDSIIALGSLMSIDSKVFIDSLDSPDSIDFLDSIEFLGFYRFSSFP